MPHGGVEVDVDIIGVKSDLGWQKPFGQVAVGRGGVSGVGNGSAEECRPSDRPYRRS